MSIYTGLQSIPLKISDSALTAYLVKFPEAIWRQILDNVGADLQVLMTGGQMVRRPADHTDASHCRSPAPKLGWTLIQQASKPRFTKPDPTRSPSWDMRLYVSACLSSRNLRRFRPPD